LRAGALRHDGGGKTNSAAAYHRDFARTVHQRPLHGEIGGTPGQRPAAAAVTVIVNHQRVADLFGFDTRPLGAEWPETHSDVE
jgi:hypothetical protein